MYISDKESGTWLDMASEPKKGAINRSTFICKNIIVCIIILQIKSYTTVIKAPTNLDSVSHCLVNTSKFESKRRVNIMSTIKEHCIRVLS